MPIRRHTLTPLINPRSITIVGASSRPGHFANQPLMNLRKFGYSGEVFPVNPQHGELEGWPCYPSVDDLPAVPDLAVIAVRRNLCVKTLEECALLGVPTAIVVASGFAETGDAEDTALQSELVEIVERTGIRVCGPNRIRKPPASPFARLYCARVSKRRLWVYDCQPGLEAWCRRRTPSSCWERVGHQNSRVDVVLPRARRRTGRSLLYGGNQGSSRTERGGQTGMRDEKAGLRFESRHK
jgi:predicted CoA-binding protein